MSKPWVRSKPGLGPRHARPLAMDYSPLIYQMGRDEKFITLFVFATAAKHLAEGLKIVLE